jgi:hypothetical protein
MSDDRELALLKEMREAHQAYRQLVGDRPGELASANPQPMTAEQLAAMQRVMAAEEAWQAYRKGSV